MIVRYSPVFTAFWRASDALLQAWPAVGGAVTGRWVALSPHADCGFIAPYAENQFPRLLPLADLGARR